MRFEPTTGLSTVVSSLSPGRICRAIFKRSLVPSRRFGRAMTLPRGPMSTLPLPIASRPIRWPSIHNSTPMTLMCAATTYANASRGLGPSLPSPGDRSLQTPRFKRRAGQILSETSPIAQKLQPRHPRHPAIRRQARCLTRITRPQPKSIHSARYTTAFLTSRTATATSCSAQTGPIVILGVYRGRAHGTGESHIDSTVASTCPSLTSGTSGRLTKKRSLAV
jgi:hypothetical protein